MKIRNTFVLLGLSLVLFCGCKKDEDKKPKKESDIQKIVVGTSADYVPFSFQKKGEIVGFEIDLIKKICKKAKCDPEFKDMNFETLLGALQTQKVDMAISAMTVTDERKKNVAFSKPYYEAEVVLLVSDKASISSIDDLKDQTVGVQSGSTHELKAKEWENNKKIKVQSFAKMNDVIQALKTDKVKAIVLGATEAEGALKKNKDLKIIKSDGKTEAYSIAFPKGSKWVAEFDRELEDLKKNGEIEELRKRWFKKKSKKLDKSDSDPEKQDFDKSDSSKPDSDKLNSSKPDTEKDALALKKKESGQSDGSEEKNDKKKDASKPKEEPGLLLKDKENKMDSGSDLKAEKKDDNKGTGSQDDKKDKKIEKEEGSKDKSLDKEGSTPLNNKEDQDASKANDDKNKANPSDKKEDDKNKEGNDKNKESSKVLNDEGKKRPGGSDEKPNAESA